MNITQIIAIILLVLMVLLYIIWQIIKNGYRKTVIDLIVLAEKNFKNNQVKFESVVNGLINKLPFPVNLIPVSIVSSFVQKVFDECKSALDYQNIEK